MMLATYGVVCCCFPALTLDKGQLSDNSPSQPCRTTLKSGWPSVIKYNRQIYDTYQLTLIKTYLMFMFCTQNLVKHCMLWTSCWTGLCIFNGFVDWTPDMFNICCVFGKPISV